MRVLSRRNPEVLFLATLVVCAAVLVGRVLIERQRSSLSINSNAPAPVAAQMSAKDLITTLQDRIRRNANDVDAYEQLGLAYVQRVRETADPTLYTQADAAFTAALQHDPQSFNALVGKGSLALSRHQFVEAIRWGQQAQALNPYNEAPYGIIGDAQTELGQYADADRSIQKMVDTRPGLSAYSRVSYQRELHGDVAGAIALMEQAVKAGSPNSEGALWARYQLGTLWFNRGDFKKATAAYQATLVIRPDYVYARAGMAKVLAALGKNDDALKIYSEVVKTLPLAEFVINYGDLLEATGRTAEAQKQFDLVHAIQKLSLGAGVDVDLELALFDADHGVAPQDVVARARASYARRPSIYGADVLAWALYQAGSYDEARKYSIESLRLGTQDALLHFHAGMIAKALGDKGTARTQLQEALTINPSFSLRYTGEASRTLAALAE